MTKDIFDGPSLQDFLPDVSQGYQAVAGAPRSNGATGKASEANVIAKIETIQDKIDAFIKFWPEKRTKMYQF